MGVWTEGYAPLRQSIFQATDGKPKIDLVLKRGFPRRCASPGRTVSLSRTSWSPPSPPIAASSSILPCRRCIRTRLASHLRKCEGRLRDPSHCHKARLADISTDGIAMVGEYAAGLASRFLLAWERLLRLGGVAPGKVTSNPL